MTAYQRLPRIRGGVSVGILKRRGEVLSSPHTRGCFLFRQASVPRRAVFPAYAGVFLNSKEKAKWLKSLPRIRGGVSGKEADK